MKKLHVLTAAAMCGALALCGCAGEVMNEVASEPNSLLTVRTRADQTEGAVVKTPVKVFVFNDQGVCEDAQTLDDESTSFTMRLPAGTYDVMAVGGLDDDRYELPTTIEKTSPIVLKEGSDYDDLMSAKSTITLEANQTNTLTLAMQRKVMLIERVTINKVPAGAKAVSVSIAKLRENLLINGDYQGENGACTIQLARQDDGTTWKMADAKADGDADGDSGGGSDGGRYELPSVGNPTITVTIDDQSYSYTLTKELQANHKVSIEGTYYDDGTVSLSGVITGATWDDDETISFQFNEDGSQEVTKENGGDNGNDNGSGSGEKETGTIPAVGSLYKGCYVLSVSGKEVTLLSPSEKYGIGDQNISQADLRARIDQELKDWEKTISSSWRLMNKEEATYIGKNINTINNSDIESALNQNSYYFDDNNQIFYFFTINSKTELVYTEGGYPQAGLRPVTTVTFE